MKEVLAEMRRVNSGRRIRRIDLYDIGRCIREAHSYGIGYTTGGKVANTYRYPATTAAVAVLRSGRNYYVRFASINAKRDSSIVTWFGPVSEKTIHLKAWVAKMTAYPLTYDCANVLDKRWIRLSATDLAVLRRVHTLITSDDLECPEVEVTYEDSIAAGNCRTETDRVQHSVLHDATSMSSRTLLRTIANEVPSLLRYARRAVAAAVLRSGGRA